MSGRLLSANAEVTEANDLLRIANDTLVMGTEDAQAAREEAETLTEELQVSNEELETLNEELQASVEELNVANEELNVANEDLATPSTYRCTDPRARMKTLAASRPRGLAVELRFRLGGLGPGGGQAADAFVSQTRIARVDGLPEPTSSIWNRAGAGGPQPTSDSCSRLRTTRSTASHASMIVGSLSR